MEILNQIADMHSEKPVVVIDEFDAIASAEERNKFAALLKQMGDRSVNVKFIFTGIANTLDELLGAHQSAYRQLETVELPRLGWNARREIVLSAVSNFGLDIDNNVNWRIAMISDGYREKMLRGYVRMQAQANGIELTGERPSPKQTMHVGNARSGYRGASVPQGVRIGKDISEWDKE